MSFLSMKHNGKYKNSRRFETLNFQLTTKLELMK